MLAEWKNALMLYSCFLNDTNYRVTLANLFINWGTAIHLIIVHKTQYAVGDKTALEIYIYKFRNFNEIFYVNEFSNNS